MGMFFYESRSRNGRSSRARIHFEGKLHVTEVSKYIVDAVALSSANPHRSRFGSAETTLQGLDRSFDVNLMEFGLPFDRVDDVLSKNFETVR